ncbi:Uncharacterised protein [Mycobacteroides abscessus subsp. abscessus]|nr:Uncharacterised protein [Mycobacteroides abscessus subsp. abscessus]
MHREWRVNYELIAFNYVLEVTLMPYPGRVLRKYGI